MVVVTAISGCTLNDRPYRISPEGEWEYNYSFRPLYRIGIPEDKKPGYFSNNPWYRDYIRQRIQQEFENFWAREEHQATIRKIQPDERIFLQFIMMADGEIVEFWMLRDGTHAGADFLNLVAKLMTEIKIHPLIPADWSDEKEYYIFNHVFTHPDAKKDSTD